VTSPASVSASIESLPRGTLSAGTGWEPPPPHDVRIGWLARRVDGRLDCWPPVLAERGDNLAGHRRTWLASPYRPPDLLTPRDKREQVTVPVTREGRHVYLPEQDPEVHLAPGVAVRLVGAELALVLATPDGVLVCRAPPEAHIPQRRRNEVTHHHLEDVLRSDLPGHNINHSSPPIDSHSQPGRHCVWLARILAPLTTPTTAERQGESMHRRNGLRGASCADGAPATPLALLAAAYDCCSVPAEDGRRGDAQHPTAARRPNCCSAWWACT
jgi:hypothetical protein